MPRPMPRQPRGRRRSRRPQKALAHLTTRTGVVSPLTGILSGLHVAKALASLSTSVNQRPKASHAQPEGALAASH